MLTRNFYLRDANIVARELLGKLLVQFFRKVSDSEREKEQF